MNLEQSVMLFERIRKVVQPVLVPINRAGYPFIALFAVADGLLWFLNGTLGWLGLILLAWCVYFFRDPERYTPKLDGGIISPADGVVAEVATVTVPDEIPLPYADAIRIGIFMNVFDVHVNRSVCDGRGRARGHYPGSFLVASLDKASTQNERQMVVLETTVLRDQVPVEVAMMQIAGLVARRIVCTVEEGQNLEVGERFGLIRFGSRVDVYLPTDAVVMVARGQRMLAGQTVLACLGMPPETQWGRVTMPRDE